MIAALLVSLTLCWPPPVTTPVVRAFEAPACTWCAGHRGVEFRPPPDSPVTAVAPGVVVFTGRVAGTGYVVVRLADGRRVTYGYVHRLSVRPGQAVSQGQVLAHTTDRLFLGVRVGEGEAAVYVDPGPLLGRWRGVSRLVPADGSAPRPARTGGAARRFTCATGADGR
jgi:murein DD-endopeptidase MepM/ murein hydrolase activator NlpD